MPHSSTLLFLSLCCPISLLLSVCFCVSVLFAASFWFQIKSFDWLSRNNVADTLYKIFINKQKAAFFLFGGDKGYFYFKLKHFLCTLLLNCLNHFSFLFSSVLSFFFTLSHSQLHTTSLKHYFAHFLLSVNLPSPFPVSLFHFPLQICLLFYIQSVSNQCNCLSVVRTFWPLAH